MRLSDLLGELVGSMDGVRSASRHQYLQGITVGEQKYTTLRLPLGPSMVTALEPDWPLSITRILLLPAYGNPSSFTAQHGPARGIKWPRISRRAICPRGSNSVPMPLSRTLSDVPMGTLNWLIMAAKGTALNCKGDDSEHLTAKCTLDNLSWIAGASRLVGGPRDSGQAGRGTEPQPYAFGGGFRLEAVIIGRRETAGHRWDWRCILVVNPCENMISQL